MMIFKLILIIILAFALGVTVTLFCMRIKDRKKDEDGCDI